VGFRTILEYLQEAINKTGSVDPTKIAFALEGMKRKDLFNYDTMMRKEDHQVMMEYMVGQLSKGTKYDSEGTGLGWKVSAVIEAKDLMQPTTCLMKRPAK
jgi:branched-chain amino acid transport system substrate-binding protein